MGGGGGASAVVGGGEPTFGEAVGIGPVHAMTSMQVTAATTALMTARRWIGSGCCATLTAVHTPQPQSRPGLHPRLEPWRRVGAEWCAEPTLTHVVVTVRRLPLTVVALAVMALSVCIWQWHDFAGFSSDAPSGLVGSTRVRLVTALGRVLRAAGCK
jgi:hypothetical protein